ncbi:MAG: hypothetical protein ACI4F2_02910 [Acutalibacteraceae bacterium]
MKEIYRRALNKTTPSQKAVSKAKALYDSSAVTAESTDNITQLKPMRKPRAYKGVIAASLAVVLSLGAIFGGGLLAAGNTGGTQPQYGFIITANAAEITHEQPASITLDDGAMNYGYGGDFGEPVFDYNTVFPIKCEGTNIDTITYSISNSAFQIAYLDNSPVLSGTELENTLNVGSHSPKAHNGETTYIKQYSSFTLSYDNQESDNFAIDIVGLRNLSSEEHDIMFADDPNVEEEVKFFNNLLKDSVIDVAVKFNDGTIQNEKILIGCETKPYTDGPKSGIEPVITFSLAPDES